MAISGGQRQLIGLARAVVGNPALVVLDEPNSNLDGPGENRLMACVAALRQAGTTVIMVSHRPNLLREFDGLTHLRDGTVVASGEADEIMQRMLRPAGSVAVVARAQIVAQSGEAG
ncbi:ATP-binding cassette domain-containing protein [Oleomonas cavernae]|uniref:ATP-binding cassette domain-containing protein n=1 Tax=Oleomonas cavernae TaxID=2320859 RepID=A0A418W8V4_9PROT|nr:ATP-binding cassette domain-containing protein [Oleomonas cavernae]